MNSSVQPNIKIIKKRSEIKHILQNGHRVRSRFGNFYLLNGHHSEKRMAVLIKKHVGNAVQRNYRKRIVREYIRKNISDICGMKRYNELVFLFNYKGEINYHQLSKGLSNIFDLK